MILTANKFNLKINKLAVNVCSIVLIHHLTKLCLKFLVFVLKMNFYCKKDFFLLFGNIVVNLTI
jgi:hypothetical protein